MKKQKKEKTKLMTREEVIEFLRKRDSNYDQDYDYYHFGSGTVAKVSDFNPIAFDSPY